MQISNKLGRFRAQKFCKPTTSVYYEVLLVPSFESTSYRPKTMSCSSSYADFSEAPFHTRSWGYIHIMAHS